MKKIAGALIIILSFLLFTAGLVSHLLPGRLGAVDKFLEESKKVLVQETQSLDPFLKTDREPKHGSKEIPAGTNR